MNTKNETNQKVNEMSENKLFEIAVREKYRFETGDGKLVTVEDLWDLPLTANRLSLDDVAKTINRKLKQVEEESFVVTRNREDTVLQNKLDIVKYVISVKIAERDAKVNEQRKRQQNQEIRAIIERKKQSELESKSVEELEAMLQQ